MLIDCIVVIVDDDDDDVHFGPTSVTLKCILKGESSELVSFAILYVCMIGSPRAKSAQSLFDALNIEMYNFRS